MLARSMQPRLAERARFASTHGRMWWAAFSPDGSQVVTADDRAAQVWDGRTYQLLHTLPHGCGVYQAVYSADGAKLMTAAEEMVRIWDARSGALLHDLKARPGRASDFFRIATSPDGRLVAAIDADGSVVHVWNTTTGEILAELRSRAGSFAGLAFSVDGYLAMTGGFEARVFDVRTWRHAATVPGPVRSLAFDARSRLLTGTVTGEVALWAVPSGARLRQLRQFGESADAVAFAKDGKLVAAGSRDGAMQVWHSDSGALQGQLNPRRSAILGIEFDATSKRLLAANADGTVVVADVAQGLPIAILDGPRNVVRVARFDASSRIVGASWDGTARIWDADSPYRQWTSEPMSASCGIIMRAEVARRFMAVGCNELPTRVWDTAHDQLVAELPSVTIIADGGYTSAFPAVSALGNRAAIARGNAVELYELPGGRLLRTVTRGAPVSAVAFASTGRGLVTGAVDGSLFIIRDDGKEIALQASAGIDAVELLSDGRVLASDAERHLRVYGPDGAVLADLEMPARIVSLRRNGSRVVALPSYIGEAAPPLLVALDHYRVIARMDAHVGLVFSARWVSGNRLVTAGADGTARLWDGASGQLLRSYQGSSRFLADATLTQEGMVIAGDADGKLHFWEADTGKKLWMLQAHKTAIIRIHVEGDDLVTRGFAGEVSRWRLPTPEKVIAACGNRCAIVP
jgi:WD40 repeat protein